MLYNIPGRTGVQLSIETIEKLAQHPRIMAIKEATGSTDSASEIVLRAPKLALLSGDDSMTLPFMAVGANLDPALAFDIREIERQEDVLSYTSAPLEAPLTLCGRFEVELHMAADTPDCDVVCWLAQVPETGLPTALSMGLLRLRYRQGFDREVLLTPGEPTIATIAMKHVAWELPAGSRLQLFIGSDLFPLIDPNPNNGEPIATAASVQIARETIFHDALRPSHIRLPVVAGALQTWDRR
jgi:predicted acyl esterase